MSQVNLSPPDANPNHRVGVSSVLGILEEGLKPMSGLKVVTTSWDDGDPLDLKVADMLCSRGLRGTFYVPLDGYKDRARLGRGDIRAFPSLELEIGAHSCSHLDLSALDPAKLAYEVSACKDILQDILGREVQMFSYPNGQYDRSVIRALKRAGYSGGRTTRMFRRRFDFPPFEMPTSIQAYPHSGFAYVRNVVEGRNLPALWEFTSKLRHFRGWVSLGKSLFDSVLREDGIWHLYGHSWEIERLGLWTPLEELLDYVSRRKSVRYVNNGEVVKFLQQECQSGSAKIPVEVR